jgi:RNA polymerase sigma-70 factor, ECF subfamily
MQSTPETLIQRLRRNDNPAAWERFVELFSPLMFEWCRRNRVPESEAADLVQNVLVILIKQMRRFEQRPGGSFRRWLFTVLRNCWLDQCRARRRQPAIAPGVSPDDYAGNDPISELTDEEYWDYLIRRTLKVIQADFSPATWQLFWQHVAEGQSPREIAKTTGVTANTVYLARARILKRLREELAEFLN